MVVVDCANNQSTIPWQAQALAKVVLIYLGVDTANDVELLTPKFHASARKKPLAVEAKPLYDVLLESATIGVFAIYYSWDKTSSSLNSSSLAFKSS